MQEWQSVFGFEKTRTSAYRPQDNSVLECVHSTMQNMFAMYETSNTTIWAELLPFIQLAHNTDYNKKLEETPHFFNVRP